MDSLRTQLQIRLLGGKGKGKLKRKGTEMDTDRDIRGQQRQVPRLGCLAKIAEGGRATSYSTTSSKDSEMMEI